VEYGLFSGFFMNKFACRTKMAIDIFLIFCHDILAMILFRILTKSKGVSGADPGFVVTGGGA
jgi:hypothetical protein